MPGVKRGDQVHAAPWALGCREVLGCACGSGGGCVCVCGLELGYY